MVSEKKSPRVLATPGHTTGRHGVGDGSRNIFTPPTPERGEWGRFVRVVVSNEKKQPSWTASSFERKTRLELATPTLARLCSTN